MSRITVVIPTYNRPEWMLKTAYQVVEQANSSLIEILLVDQTPWDSISQEYQGQINILKENSLIKYHQLDYPNLPHARNYALTIALGEIILFLDDDVLLPLNFITEHLRCYEYSDVIAVTGELFQRLNAVSFLDLSIKSPEKGTYKVYNGEFNLLHGKHLSGGNHSVLKVYAQKCGGYDENLTTLGEDVDFTNRLRSKFPKKKIAYNPRAYILHLRAPSGGCRLSGKSSIPEYKHLVGQFLISFRYSEKSSYKILFENLRLGPLRKENIINLWLQPYAWYSYFKAFVIAIKNITSIRNRYF